MKFAPMNYHYLRYPHAADAAEGESAKLLLSKNFRSRDTVLDAGQVDE